jgi:ubiquinone/menaquinone biosynthesis C-methylase UbiE
VIREKEPRVVGASREYFDSLGSQWDRLREGFFSEAVRKKALEAAGVERGRLAVDIGAGTGFVTHGLAASGLRVIAVDQSPVMLNALRQKFPEEDSVDCREGGAERLPIADAVADYCFANMLLHHVETPSMAIREMARVVRPSGRVVVTDLDAHDHEFLKTEHHDRWMGFAREEVRRWFEQAGLTSIRVERVGEDCSARSCDGSLAAVSIFLAIGTVPGSPQP